jgi:hypothetical protein
LPHDVVATNFCSSQVFASALRLARNFGERRFIGIEYYTNLGQVGNDQVYAVTDFEGGKFEVELGIGYGLTPESDLERERERLLPAFGTRGATESLRKIRPRPPAPRRCQGEEPLIQPGMGRATPAIGGAAVSTNAGRLNGTAVWSKH